MGSGVFLNFKLIVVLVLACHLLLSGCVPENELLQEDSTPVKKEIQPAITPAKNTSKIDITYKNQSSEISITLDPATDEFYLDLSGITPVNSDTVIVQDSSLIKNRQKDIQVLMASFRKAQDLFYLGEYNKALEQVNRSIEVGETADALALKGTIFFMMENITAAKVNWYRAVELDPDLPVPSIPELEALIKEVTDN